MCFYDPDSQPSTEADTAVKRDAVERLVRLYEVWDKAEKAAEWRQKL
jgi:hypothetical protein